MDKNTIIAIVLSTLILVGFYFVIPMFTGTNQIPETQNVAAEIENIEAEKEVKDISDLNLSAEISEAEESESTENEVISEQSFTVNTGVAEITLTNKGGDITSYLLNSEKHKDTDTGKGVQLADNISNTNRACAITLGTAESRIVNDIFDVKKIDDYTYLFTKAYKNGGKKFTLGKKYTFKPNEYAFKLEVLIHSNDGSGLNNNGVAYSIRTAPQIGPHFNSKQNRYENRQFIGFNGSKAKKIILANGQWKKYDKDLTWAGIAGKYFLNLVIPTDPTTISDVWYSSQVEVNDYANAQSMFERKAFSGSDVQDTYYMYYGPRDEKELKRFNESSSNDWGISGYKLTNSLQTMGMLSWLETILRWCLEILHKIIPNWGLCIIVLTIILKCLMFPLSKNQSMSTLKMQELQPQMQKIQSKYKDDQQKMQIELSKLYKEAGYNPAGGCLPMIFQFLILFAMYNLFNNYFEFRGAEFIPHWIPDLSVGDSVYSFKGTIPVISGLFGNQVRILPVIYVATQLLYGKITQNGGMNGGQNAATMKFMTYGMPLMFFFLFYNAPAGLLLYWTVSNLFQMIQQIFINNMMAAKKAEMSDSNANKKLHPKAKRK